MGRLKKKSEITISNIYMNTVKIEHDTGFKNTETKMKKLNIEEGEENMHLRYLRREKRVG